MTQRRDGRQCWHRRARQERWRPGSALESPRDGRPDPRIPVPQSPQAQTRSVPVFEVDPAWPKLSPQFKLGDASSFAIDAQDNVWLLHRPRTLKPEESGKAAPAIVVFDAAGNFMKAWGGAGSGYDWPEREHGIHIDHKGFVWIGGNNCPTSGLAGLKPVADAHFNVAHAIRVANDGMVYLADRENRRVQMFTNDGKFVKQLIRTGTTFARNLALSADAGQQFLYVGADKGITVVDRKTLDVVGTIQPSGILGPGHHIATDSKGNIFLAQTTAGMQKLVFKGMSPTQ